MNKEFCVNFILGTSIISILILALLFTIYYIGVMVYILYTLFNISACSDMFALLLITFIVFIPLLCNNNNKHGCTCIKILAQISAFIILIVSIVYLNSEIECKNANMIYNSLTLNIILISIYFTFTILMYILLCIVLVSLPFITVDPIFKNLIINTGIFNVNINLHKNLFMNNYEII